MIFLDSDARNALHEGKEVEGQGFLTVIDMEAKKLDFSCMIDCILGAHFLFRSTNNAFSDKPSVPFF